MGGIFSSSSKKMDVSGKLIVITGGGSGMGLEMAKSFAQDGAHVVITGRTKSKLETAAKEHENITPFVCDVSKDDDMIKLRDAMEKKGGVDFLINSK
jgi:short-subunit dehydrogenase involved in D-alanine esterification of teichoic acids